MLDSIQKRHISADTVWMQTSAVLACQQLGFVDGAFLPAVDAAASVDGNAPPPWLPKEQLECGDAAESLLKCDGLNFGATALCGPTQELFCTASPSMYTRLCRLVNLIIV